MAFCGKCGTRVEDGNRFCPGCGAPVAGQPQQGQWQQPQQGQWQQPQQQGYPEEVPLRRERSARQDAQENKAMAILAYLGILVLIPLFAAKDSPFARFHTNQGLVLAITEILYGVVYGILSAILMLISWKLVFLVSILGFLGLVFLVPMVMGILNAVNGRKQELPVIGKFRILK